MAGTRSSARIPKRSSRALAMAMSGSRWTGALGKCGLGTLRSSSSRSAYVLLALALFGCGDDGGTQPEASRAEGTWVGITTGDAQEGVLEWTLQDTDGDISGSGSLSTATDTVALTIEGTFSPPNLSLTVSPQGFDNFTFFGTVGEESMKGRLNGAGFVNRTVTLDRQ